MLSFPRKKSSGGTGKVGMNVEEWEIRPGGMLVQKRNLDSNQSVTVPTIKVRVKFGSTYHEVCANSIASFGNGKFLIFSVSFLCFKWDNEWSLSLVYGRWIEENACRTYWITPSGSEVDIQKESERF